MIKNEINVPVPLIYDFMKEVFIKSGVPEKDAIICSDVLIKSDLRGIESHGIGRLRMYYERLKQGLIEPITELKIVRESPTTAVVDGQHGIGMVIGKVSMEIAIKKAQKYGMGAVAVRNSTHFGIDGYYALMAVKAGMIGMSFTNARPCVAPTFGTQAVLGTNPIAFGAPTDEECPFLFDGATSITQRGKVEVLERAEKQVPRGWVIDANGDDMQDPVAILKQLPAYYAALLPLGGKGELLGGHKGYGFSTIVEILSSALQSGAFLFQLSGFDQNKQPTRFRVGHFFMAINIESFLPLKKFKHNIGELLRTLRSSRKAPGQKRIYTAGEKEFEIERRIEKQGIPINKNLQKDIQFLQQELQLTRFTFGF